MKCNVCCAGWCIEARSRSTPQEVSASDVARDPQSRDPQVATVQQVSTAQDWLLWTHCESETGAALAAGKPNVVLSGRYDADKSRTSRRRLRRLDEH